MKISKKALSNVIATMTLILLTIVAVGVIWVTINDRIQENIDSGEACGVDVIDQATINSRYTCYNQTSQQFQFSINIGNIDPDYLLISIDGNGISKSFEMSNNELVIPYVTNYPSGTNNVKLPGKNSGKTYYFDVAGSELSGKPDSIKIAPTINNVQCQKTDSLNQIDYCEALI